MLGKKLVLPSSLTVLLLMMPLAVYSTIEGLGHILAPADALPSLSVLATGTISIVIAVVWLLRFWTGDEGKQRLLKQFPTSPKEQQIITRQKSKDDSNGKEQYPQIYFTATRPCSVNVKPMLMLSNEIQSFVERIDHYTDSLEGILSQRINELNVAKGQLDGLLHQLLPPSVAHRFSAGERVAPATFECVTIYYCDIVGYTTIVAQSTALEMVEFLNAQYRMTDAIVEKYDAYKVETIGDADLIASGIPTPNGTKHATEIAKLSIDMMKAFTGFRLPHRPSESLQVRIGLHSGHCMAGIVGTKIPKYCLFGDAVSTATKMESTSEPGRIQMSCKTAEILRGTGGFVMQSRGKIQLKGKKDFETFWLEREDHNHA
ncbi:Guanylyl cyclase GC-E [Hypsibius exemplaris]|uniref:Guanylyl cyclase GC-E n=1 Tax=Hypsibius exemplaris TaxID=2072580 RepID=A0A9X6NNS8_HYPEX|nr:Guanylyl cyclase GC-E [Hypsibius exemplaris]